MAEATDDPRVYFAAERTFLASIRTGLGLMGVGFAVARFGLFLRELRDSPMHAPVHSTGLSVDSGVPLVAIGVTVNIGAVIHRIHTVRTLRAGTYIPGKVSKAAMGLGLLLAAVGIGMGACLLLLRYRLRAKLPYASHLCGSAVCTLLR